MPPEAIRARAEGFNEMRDKLPVLTRVHVHYALTIPPGTREKVDRALVRHAEKCPTAVSLAGAVDVTWSADIEEAAPGEG
ncbi:MAG: OsmC family protein [Gemmatimonadetes bacterium]|nr:OsmC family protein [Gemmatimonadota bacterium]